MAGSRSPIRPTATKRVSPDGISDTRNAMTGYVIVKAESHEAAARLFEDHPHFSILEVPGATRHARHVDVGDHQVEPAAVEESGAPSSERRRRRESLGCWPRGPASRPAGDSKRL